MTMTDTLPDLTDAPARQAPRRDDVAPTMWRLALQSRRIVIGGGILAAMVLLCITTLRWTTSTRTGPHGEDTQIRRYLVQDEAMVRKPPHLTREVNGVRRIDVAGWFGYDTLGRSVLVRSLVGGTISLAVGAAAATISVLLGVAIGLLAGYRGGWLDALLMRSVDIMYGLPYILLVILFKIAFEQPLTDGIRRTTAAWTVLLFVGLFLLVFLPALLWAEGKAIARIGGACLAALALAGLVFARGDSPERILRLNAESANLVVLFSAIGLVSWLTMSRVVRGQVLSLRGQPFVEACRAMGLRERRVFARHILPNLIGPITVYATLTVPSAILQESFLSFLGVGVSPPLATWGSLASEGVEQLSPLKFYWWLLLFPCALLAVTLLSLNFLGDGLRDVFDPKRESAKI